MKKALTFNALLLFTEAWFALGIARLILVLVPFKKIFNRKSSALNSDPYTISTGNQPRVQELSLAIARAAKRAPWRTMCFEQALAGRMMLKARHIPYVLTLGVRKDEQTQELLAHAWLKTGDIIITGGSQMQQFTPIGSFNN